MKKLFMIAVTVIVFSGCASQKVNTENRLMDIAKKSQSFNSILGATDEKDSSAVNNSARRNVAKNQEQETQVITK